MRIGRTEPAMPEGGVGRTGRGRKRTTPPPSVESQVDYQRLEADGAALAEIGRRSMEVAERFGDGTPYERGRVVSEARFYMAAGAEALMELGKRLLQIKEAEPHGEFTRIVTEQLGIPDRTARRAMEATLKFLSPIRKRPELGILNKAKLFELLGESDGDLDALASGGSLAGLKLEDIELMTARQLREKLKAARRNLEAKDAVIAQKDRKLNELAERAEAEHRSSAQGQREEQLRLLQARNLAAERELDALLAAVDELMDTGVDEAVKLSARHAVDYMAQRMVDICQERRIALNLEERVTPLHLEPVAAIVKAASVATPRKRG